MTLMPVSNISVVGVSDSTLGAGRWMGQRSSVSTSPARSIGSPRRLKIRPRVASPTGTVIGLPESTTSMPRERPSVESMATARTRSSPRCCWTSQTRTSALVPVSFSSSSDSSPLGRSMVRAWLISGSASEKTASTTTPWISSMRPTFRAFSEPLPSSWPGSWSACSWSWSGSCSVVVSIWLAPLIRSWFACLGQRLGTRDHFEDLLRDLGLPGAIHLQRKVLDDLARILRRAAHGGHARAMLGGRRFQQRAVDRDLDVVGHQALKDLLGVGLVLHERPTVALGDVRLLILLLVVSVPILVLLLEDVGLLERQQRLPAHLLAQR